MAPDREATADLLQAWHEGRREALDHLLARNLDWIERHVRRRLGPDLRAREETLDVVQDAVIDILTYGPRFVVTDREHFRALVGRMVENNLRDKRDFYDAKRRARTAEQSRPADSVLFLDARRPPEGTPSEAAGTRELTEFMRLAVQLLEPQDREVIVLREYDGLGFPEIAQRLGTSANGARMRYNRAVPRVAAKVRALRAGAVADALGAGPTDRVPEDDA